MKKFFQLLCLFLVFCSSAFAAESTTPNLGLTKPAFSSPSWAPKTNVNWDIVDSAVGSVYGVQAYGVVGDGVTDDTAAWAALIAAIPNYSIINLPHGLVSLITAPIDISGKKGLVFRGTTSGSASDAGTGQPVIKYTGTAGGTIVLCSPCQDMVFEGIYFDGNDLADFGFKALYNGGPTYNAQFRNVTIDRGATGRTAWIAVDWCGTGTTSNCEQLVVEGLHLIGSGHGSTSIGIRIGHSNSVQNKIDGTTISYFNQGVRIGGTVQVTRNLFDNNNVDISCQGSESMEIAFNRTENGRQFFNGNCPIFMHDNRFGSHDGSPASAWINIGANASTATLVFINNVFTLTDTLAPFAGASRLFSANNLYPTAAISNGVVTSMETFNAGYISFNDGIGIVNQFSTGSDRSLAGRNPFYVLHVGDYFGVINATGTKYNLFGSDASANQFFGDTAKPTILSGSSVTVTNRTTGTPAKFACFTSAGILVESAVACQ